MKFDELEQSLDRIVAIVGKMPEPFKERTFDALFSLALAIDAQGQSGREKIKDQPGGGVGHGNGATPEANDTSLNKTKGRYSQFLSEKGITAADVRKIVELEGSEAMFYRSPKAEPKAAAQINWALLLALVNGMKTGSLAVRSDSVREHLKDEKIIDSPNFAKNFKDRKALFVGAMTKGDPERRLSPDGEETLAALIKAMIA